MSLIRRIKDNVNERMVADNIKNQNKFVESLEKIAPKSEHEWIEPPEGFPEVPVLGVETAPGIGKLMMPLLSLQIKARDQQILRWMVSEGYIKGSS